MNRTRRDRQGRRAALWFGLSGGGLAWTVHLVTAYGISEFGCLSRLAEHDYLGITSVAWLALALTAATTTAAVTSTIVAYRTYRRLRPQAALEGATWDDERKTAWAGLLTSGTFTFIIVFESIPLLYYLHRC